MARLVFTGVRPVSVNKMYYRNRKLTEEARKARAIILVQLQSQLDKLQDIKSQFNPRKHYLAFSYTFYYPEDIFWTKTGQVSNRSQDLDNCLKLITDCLCNTKYDTSWLLDRKPRYKPLYKSLKSLSNLGIDDRFICDLESVKKRPNKTYLIEVDIELKELSLLR